MKRLGLRIIGTQPTLVSESREDGATAETYFLEVDAARATWQALSKGLIELRGDSGAGRQLHHVERLAIPSARSRWALRAAATESTIPDASEMVVVCPPGYADIRGAFLHLANAAEVRVVDAYDAGRLTHYSVRGSEAALRSMCEFVYVRRAQPLERVRQHDRMPPDTVRPLDGYAIAQTPPRTGWRASLLELAATPPVESAGFATGRVHGAHARATETSLMRHSAAVASAYAFGPLPETPGLLGAPSSALEVVQIGDGQTDDPVTIGRQLAEALADTAVPRVGPLLNISMGPREEIADGSVSPWTVAVDQCCARGDRLCTVAVGNDGDQRPALRLGPPGDGANVVTVGAFAARHGAVRLANYSSHGPGRLGARQKPDIVTFGGSASDPFWVLPPVGDASLAHGVAGTSYAAPLVLRSAALVADIVSRGDFPRDATPWLVTRAVLLHARRPLVGAGPALGGGLLLGEPTDFLSTDDDAARLLYTGVLPLKRVTQLRVPTPSVSHGRVEVRVTVCLATPVEPADAAQYTQAGVTAGLYKVRPDGTRTSMNALRLTRAALFESEQRKELMKWESTMAFDLRVDGPFARLELDLHALRRTAVGRTPDSPVSYAAVVTTRRKGDNRWYANVLRALGQRVRPLALPTRLRATL
jgi:hypothetical protein